MAQAPETEAQSEKLLPMTFYRKKPVEIEAFQVAFDSPTPKWPWWFVDAVKQGAAWYQGGETPYYTIKTLEGEMRANRSDWIARGIAGELYPVRPDIFAATYEPVEEP